MSMNEILNQPFEYFKPILNGLFNICKYIEENKEDESKNNEVIDANLLETI